MQRVTYHMILFRYYSCNDKIIGMVNRVVVATSKAGVTKWKEMDVDVAIRGQHEGSS